MLLGAPSPKGQLPRSDTQGRPARCLFPARRALAPAPHTRRATCRVLPQPTAPRTQGCGSLSLQLLAPTNTGQTRSQPSGGEGHLHARFMHDSRVTCPPVTSILVQHHTDVPTARRPGAQASPIRALPQPFMESRSPQGSVPPRRAQKGRRWESSTQAGRSEQGSQSPRTVLPEARPNTPRTLCPEAAPLLLAPKSHQAPGSPTEVPVTCLRAPPSTAAHILDECSKHTQ